VSGESFAGTFFISKATHADGSQTIELFGSVLIWLLLIMSIFNLGLIGYLALNNQRKSIVPPGVVDEVRRMLNAGNFRGALELTSREPSFFSKVLHSGLTQANHGFAAVIRSLEQSADALITARMRPIELLYMFGQISPMMGLLGTVYGIIFAFRVFVSMGGKASPALLAGGIGTALVATFWGLVVAIPALAGYSILRNKVDQLTMQAVTYAEDMLSELRPTTAKPSGPLPKPGVKPMPEVPR
jgi:biopolymer transport protein ExbB